MRVGAYLALVAVALLGASPAWAGLVFERTQVDTTPVATASEVLATFPFRNIGAAAVRIKAVRSDCSCTTATVGKDVYAPGEAGEVAVKFEIGHRHGPQRRAIILSTEEAAPQILLLTAALPQVITPSATILLWPEGEGAVAKTLTVRTSDTPPVKELRAAAQHPALRVETERLSPTEFRVQVTPAAGARDVSTALVLEAVLTEGPPKRANVFLRVR